VHEGFLLALCAAVVSVCRTPRALQVVVKTWCLSATAWAVIFLMAEAGGVASVPGGSGGEGGRARLWFDHPNMAGNYLVTGFFVILAARYPRRPKLRGLAIAAVLVALLLTGSNSALLSVPLGGLIMILLGVRRRRGTVPAIAVGLCAILATGALWSVAAKPLMEKIQESETAVVRYSVGRSTKSANSRESLFTQQLQLFRNGTVLGVGPSATRQVLGETRSATVKQAHSDYLGTLVERGPLGVIALVALMGAVGVRTMSAQHLSPEWSSVIPQPSALAAAAVGFAFTAVTHEVLHFRHLWLFFAIVASLHLYGRAAPDPEVNGRQPTLPGQRHRRPYASVVSSWPGDQRE
jgi:O-antigen ligase